MSKDSKKPAIRFKGFTDDWEQRELGSVSFKVTTKNIKFEFSEIFTNSAERGIIDQKEYFDHDIANSQRINSYYIVYPNDFVYNPRISTLAPVGPIRRNCLNKIGVMSPLYTVFRFNGIDYKFLDYYFLSDVWHSYMNFNGDSGARADRFSIKNEVFFKLPMIIPSSLSEQKKIGEFIYSLTKSITLHQRKLDKLKNIKKALLEKMFPRNGENIPEVRFKGFSDDWEQRKLEDVVDFLDTKRKPLKESDRINGPYPYYGASGIVDYINGYLFDEELILLSEDGANITDRNYPVCFLASGKYWVNNHAHVLKTKIGNENNFVCNSLERKNYSQFNSGMAMPKLNQDVCRNIPILCPKFKEQKKIGDYFRNLDKLITLHQRKLDKLKNIKKALLEKMFV